MWSFMLCIFLYQSFSSNTDNKNKLLFWLEERMYMYLLSLLVRPTVRSFLMIAINGTEHTFFSWQGCQGPELCLRLSHVGIPYVSLSGLCSTYLRL